MVIVLRLGTGVSSARRASALRLVWIPLIEVVSQGWSGWWRQAGTAGRKPQEQPREKTMGVFANIDDLIRGRVIEAAHVEFKGRLDPNVVVRGGRGAWRRDVSAVWGFWIGD